MRRFHLFLCTRIVLLSTAGLLMVGCSEGVNLPVISPTSIQEDAGGGFIVETSIDDPANVVNEPLARQWIGSPQSVQAQCSGLAQSVDGAFHTQAFERVLDENGEAYLLATRSESRDAPEYIEFCVEVETLANFNVRVQIKAPSIVEDSYFVTIDEDSAGVDTQPGIYDVSRSSVFKEDTVRTRTQNPLEITLNAGSHVLRFYYREPNVALKGIRLEALASSDPVLDPEDPDTTVLAQCAANTGLSVSDVETLLDTYIGNAQRSFVLQPSRQKRGYDIRDDWRWDTADGRGNIMCLGTPPADGYNLVDNTITANRLVIGSQGADVQRRATPLMGAFVANGGDDIVGVIDGGVFVGGDGDDTAYLMYDGRFEGGRGSDELWVMKDGEFIASANDDVVRAQFAGSVDGGAGTDTILRQALSGDSVDVEVIGVSFALLTPPSALTLLDPTANSVLLGWDASPDERTQGYVISVEDDRDRDTAADFGEFLNNVSLRQTSQTQYPLGEIYTDTAVFLVRAYTRLADDSYLYSEPVAVDYQAPTDDSYLSGVSLLGNSLIDDQAIQTGSLIPGAAVMLGVTGLINNSDVPLYLRLSNGLSNQTPVFNDTVANGDYRHHQAGSIQYVVSFPFDAPPQVQAFSSDGQTSLWAQELSLPPVPAAPLSPGRSQCTRAIVTQDDGLTCIPLRGGIELFDPAGGSAVYEQASLDYYGDLIDGEDGVVVQVDDRRRTPLTQLTVVTPSLQLQQAIPLDMAAWLNAGERAEPTGLVVHNGDAIISGVIRDDRCRLGADCERYEDDTLAYFIVRAAIDTGELSNYQRFGLERRPGSGVGKVIDDEVVFYGRNLVTTYDLNMLTLIDRMKVPGTVLDISDTAVLSRSYRGTGFNVGSEFYLLGR